LIDQQPIEELWDVERDLGVVPTIIIVRMRTPSCGWCAILKAGVRIRRAVDDREVYSQSLIEGVIVDPVERFQNLLLDIP
jgi:hypothetical protein